MATYHVSHAGSDSNPGTLGSPWLTLAYAEDQLVAGDTVYVKADSAYTDADGANGCVLYVEKIGTAALPITFEGYKVTPGDGATFADGSGRFEIDATEKTNGIKQYNATGESMYRHFFNMSISTASAEGIYLNVKQRTLFRNVKCINNGSYGLRIGGNSTVISCIFSNNYRGCYLNGYCKVFNSQFSSNTGFAVYVNTGCLLENCFIVHTSTSEKAIAVFNQVHIANTTIVGNGSVAAISYEAGTIPVQSDFTNNVFVNFSKGIELEPTTPLSANFASNNCFYNVTTPYTNCVSSGGDVFADPLFVDAANGNFRLQAGSPAIGAGVNGHDIGAYGYSAPAGAVQVFGLRLTV